MIRQPRCESRATFGTRNVLDSKISPSVSNSMFFFYFVTQAIRSSLSLEMSTQMRVLCWCCLIFLIHCSGDGLFAVSVASMCAVSVVTTVLDIRVSVCF